MSNKNHHPFFFDKNKQRIIFSVILVACLLIIIGLLNMELDLSSSQTNANSNQSQSKQASYPAELEIYSKYGQIASLSASQLELIVNEAGQSQKYLVNLDGDTVYLANQGEIALTDLKIGDNITAISAVSLNNKNTFLAQQIKLVSNQ